MASRLCWRCSLRPSPTARPSTASNAPFSTSSALAKSPLNAPKKGGNVKPVAQRGRKTLVINKKKKVTEPRRKPAEGERKAMRKRIVLSNTNAFDVPDLPEWSPESCCGSEAQDHIGRVVTIPGETVDALRALESFKTTQGWSFFRRPSTLIRETTAEIGNVIAASDKTQTWSRLITGPRGSGKSVLLLQAQAMALLKGWVVIHIPEAMELVNATTSYSPDQESSSNPLYIQRDYTAALLQRTLTANAKVLSQHTVSQDHNLPIKIPAAMTLDRLVELGARDPDIAWDVFKALWAELNSASANRPPTLLSIENVAHVARYSAYLTPSMHNIHAQDLHLVNHFMDYLSGTQKLTHGGIVLAADSASNRPISPALDLAIRQSKAKAKTTSSAAAAASDQTSDLDRLFAQMTLYDPTNAHLPIDERSLQKLQNVAVIEVTPFSREEAFTILQYYARSGMLRQTINDAFVSEKWAMAGHGNIGQLEKGTIRAGSV